MTDKSRFWRVANALYRRFRAANAQAISPGRIYQGLWIGLMLIVLLNGYAFGQAAFSMGSYKAARFCYGVAAFFGNGQAQNNLAGLYAQGLGGPRDDKHAAQLFQRAADNNIAQAKFNLSNFYEEGRGVPRDTNTAVRLPRSGGAANRCMLGWLTAALFVAVFPGNISQFIDGDAAFGLDTDAARALRLLFQPALVAVALWSTGAWSAWRTRR